MSLGPGRLRTSWARAEEPTLVASLSRSDLERLIRDHPEVGVRLVGLPSERLRLAHNRLADFATKGVPARLASLLLYLAEPEPTPTFGGPPPVRERKGPDPARAVRRAKGRIVSGPQAGVKPTLKLGKEWVK